MSKAVKISLSRKGKLMSQKRTLIEKQAKRIIRYIENHIKEYTVNPQIELT